MSRSVSISTPIPSLDEVGKNLGIDGQRRDFLLKLAQRSVGAGRRRAEQTEASGQMNKSKPLSKGKR